jgi:uncharacterized membrane protein
MNNSTALRRLRREPWHVQPYHLLIAAWVLTMISIPIARWMIGDDALRWGVMISVSFLAAAIITILWHSWGAARTLQTVAIVVAFSWAIEWIGSTTGLPFGRYHYTDALIPQFLHVPLAIPLAWLMMLPPAWAMAAVIGGRWRGWRFVLLSAAAFTAWDFFLDPQMVDWGFWVWENPSGYFGIPWINFGGWLLSAALLTLVAQPLPLPPRPLVAVYAITWALQTIGQIFFWQMPGPALVGCFAMGLFLALAWRKRPIADLSE